MAAIIFTMPGAPDAPYLNGGDEAYWMGQIHGALASHLSHNGISLVYETPGEGAPGDFQVALCSQQAPASQEGSRKGPCLCFRRGDAQGAWGAGILGEHLGRVYPQPELLQVVEEDALPELGEGPVPGVLVRLLYRDNPQDEAWLTRNTGAVALALARGLAEVLGAPFQHA